MRSRSTRLAAAAMSSMPQQLVAIGKIHRELVMPHEGSSSVVRRPRARASEQQRLVERVLEGSRCRRRCVGLRSLPLERASLRSAQSQPSISTTTKLTDGDEGLRAELTQHDRPGKQEGRLDVEQDEEQRDDVVARVEAHPREPVGPHRTRRWCLSGVLRFARTHPQDQRAHQQRGRTDATANLIRGRPRPSVEPTLFRGPFVTARAGLVARLVA
jgi:hypothetical protein